MCHQSVGLVARHLEANGIPTIILGSALDIIEHCGVPRFVFTDFPLGNPCGKPYDRRMQRAVVAAGVKLLEDAREPRTTVTTPFGWSEDDAWRDRYMEIRVEDAARLAVLGEARRADTISAFASTLLRRSSQG